MLCNQSTCSFTMNLLRLLTEAGTNFKSVKTFEKQSSRKGRNSRINEFRKLKTLTSKQRRFLGNKCRRKILKNAFEAVQMASQLLMF